MSFLPVKSKDSVLDCGCGSGVLLYVLKQKGCQVFGIDKKIDSLMFCRKLCKGGHFLAADLLDFTLKKKFDFVVCCDVIEHFDDFDKIKVIGNLCNHLNEKGCLLISYPSRLYFSIEPALIKLRRIFYPFYIFDDSDSHNFVKKERLIDYLKSRDLSIKIRSKACLGLIEIIACRVKSKDSVLDFAPKKSLSGLSADRWCKYRKIHPHA